MGQGGHPRPDEPTFVPASDADLLRDDDFVFGLANRGEPARRYVLSASFVEATRLGRLARSASR